MALGPQELSGGQGCFPSHQPSLLSIVLCPGEDGKLSVLDTSARPKRFFISCGALFICLPHGSRSKITVVRGYVNQMASSQLIQILEPAGESPLLNLSTSTLRPLGISSPYFTDPWSQRSSPNHPSP